MVEQLSSDRLFAEESLFAQGIRAAELTFLAQDARGADGALPSPSG